MKKQYQTKFCNIEGNCWAAVIASLLEIDLDQVPNFITFGEEAHNESTKFMLEYGYEFRGVLINSNRVDVTSEDKMMYVSLPKKLPLEESVGGYFEAVVLSKRFFNKDELKVGEIHTHAVIIDKDYNIVHDPNPAYEGIEYPMANEWGYNGVISVILWRKIEK